MQPKSAYPEKQTQEDVEYDDFNSQDGETTSFLNSNHIKETARRKGLNYLLLANLFVFVMSALTLVCAVYSQRSQSTYSAARLMDEFGVFCTSNNPTALNTQLTSDSAGYECCRTQRSRVQAPQPCQLVQVRRRVPGGQQCMARHCVCS